MDKELIGVKRLNLLWLNILVIAFLVFLFGGFGIGMVLGYIDNKEVVFLYLAITFFVIVGSALIALVFLIVSRMRYRRNPELLNIVLLNNDDLFLIINKNEVKIPINTIADCYAAIKTETELWPGRHFGHKSRVSTGQIVVTTKTGMFYKTVPLKHHDYTIDRIKRAIDPNYESLNEKYKNVPLFAREYAVFFSSLKKSGNKEEKPKNNTQPLVCNNCHKSLPEDSTFCPYCGAKIEKNLEPTIQNDSSEENKHSPLIKDSKNNKSNDKSKTKYDSKGAYVWKTILAVVLLCIGGALALILIIMLNTDTYKDSNILLPVFAVLFLGSGILVLGWRKKRKR